MDPVDFLNSELIRFVPGLNAFALPLQLSSSLVSSTFGGAKGDKIGQKSPDGGDVYYTGEDYGYQSPGSYKQVTGQYPEGYEPELGKKELRGGQPVFYAGKNYGYQSPGSYESVVGDLPPGYVPPKADETRADGESRGETGERGGELEGTGAKQSQEPVVKTTEDFLAKAFDPAFQEELSRLRTKNLVESAVVLSSLRAPRERQKQQAEIERENIQAWRDIKTAQIEANARQQMALGLATVSAMTPNLSSFGEIYKASMAPFNLRTRG
jgi:hypothetical protein